MSAQFPKGWRGTGCGEEQDCTQFAVLIQCHDSTGCNEMGDYFAIEADKMIDIVRVT